MRALSRTLSKALCVALCVPLLPPAARAHAPATRERCQPPANSLSNTLASRRHWLQAAAFGAGIGTGVGAAVPARALDALPATVRKYTALAPLGSATASVGGAKRICLSEVLPECDSRVLHSTAAAHTIDATYHAGAYRCSPRHSLEI